MTVLWKRWQSMNTETLSLKTIINELDLLKKAVIVQWNIWKRKDLLLLATKLIEKTLDPCNTKEHYQSFLRKKNTKPIKQSKLITQQPKVFENPNIVEIKSVTTENPKASYKLSKTIKQVEKDYQVGSNSFLYSDTKKGKNSSTTKKIKNNKTSKCF